MIDKYVVGFLFDNTLENIVLIKKEKPEWQKGLLNGVGGKIEKDETPLKAMVREFEEETSMKVYNWTEFLTLNAKNCQVYFFYAIEENITNVKTIAKEQIEIHNISTLHYLKTISNLKWLIPMCLDIDHNYAVAYTKNSM